MIAPDLNNAASAVARVAKAVAAGDSVLVSKASLDARRAVCGSCERNLGGQCAECTCFIKLKTLLKTETCPLSKWN